MYSYYYHRPEDPSAAPLPPAGPRSYAPPKRRGRARRRRRPGVRRAALTLCVFLALMAGISGMTLCAGWFEEQMWAFGFGAPAWDNGWQGGFYTTDSEKQLERAATGDGTTLNLLGEPAGSGLTFQEIYAKSLPSIVSIEGESGTMTSQGTGIIMTSNGYIITNHHVIEGAETVTVHRLDGSASYDALLVGSDAASDLAVLKVEAQGLTAAEFGDSAQVQVGDVALAIGNPLGEQLPGTMTDGIISYIDRSVTVDGYEMQLIQTSAALNSGNSGGALLNEYGQVVGVTTLKMSSNWDTIEALGFAIPTATVKEIVDDLIAHGAVSGRPTIGITVCAVSALPPEEAEGLPQDGLYVVSVEEGSDALEQGLRAGDVILEANGTEVSTIEDLNDQKTGLSVGDALTLTVFRDGETFTVEIHLVEQYQLKG